MMFEPPPLTCAQARKIVRALLEAADIVAAAAFDEPQQRAPASGPDPEPVPAGWPEAIEDYLLNLAAMGTTGRRRSRCAAIC
jgi:hypothetical protein